MGRGGPRDGTAVRNLAAELESLSLAAEQTPELDREPVTVCAPSSRIDGHYEPQRVFGHYCGYSRQASPARRPRAATASSGGTPARGAVVRRVPPPLSRTHTCMRFYLHARTPPRFHQPILRFFSRLLPTSSLPGCPTKIQWKPFYNNLPPPPLRGPGGFAPEELPILRKNKPIEVESADGGIAITTLADMNAGPKDEEVSYWFKILQEKMTTRFGELRRAFRTLDEDASGSLDRDEFKNVLVMFNLGIPPPIIEKIIDLADYDGDGTINYAEFARIVTTEDIFKMKNTLSAVEDGGAHAAKVRYQMAQGGKGKLDKETGENVRLRRTGPGLEKMRKAHRTLRNLILNRYPSMKACFSAIDADGSGLVRRAELRSFMSKLSKSIPDGVISGLIAYVDTDGDAKTLSREEFVRMMSEDFLDNL